MVPHRVYNFFAHKKKGHGGALFTPVWMTQCSLIASRASHERVAPTHCSYFTIMHIITSPLIALVLSDRVSIRWLVLYTCRYSHCTQSTSYHWRSPDVSWYTLTYYSTKAWVTDICVHTFTCTWLQAHHEMYAVGVLYLTNDRLRSYIRVINPI